MKKVNLPWLVILTIVALFTAFLLYFSPSNKQAQQNPFANNGEARLHPATTNNTNSEIYAPTNAIEQKQEVPNATNLSPAESRSLQIKQAIEGMNVPIDFYGKVIDQGSNDLSGVKIVFRVMQPRAGIDFAIPKNMLKLERTTDASGNFSVEGIRGSDLRMESVAKDGYQLSPKARLGYRYGQSPVPFYPDSQNPVVFRMWKTGDSVQLISQDKDTRIPYDGTPVVFDLVTGGNNVGNSSSGDLRVTLVRNPLSIPVGYKQAFEWHATIEAIGGGLIQSNDEFMYAAPEDGYQPRIQIDMPADATNWANIYDISFYAKTRGGRIYSRVKLEFRVDSTKPQTGFTITSVANPAGSRNLQP